MGRRRTTELSATFVAVACPRHSNCLLVELTSKVGAALRTTLNVYVTQVHIDQVTLNVIAHIADRGEGTPAKRWQTIVTQLTQNGWQLTEETT